MLSRWNDNQAQIADETAASSKIMEFDGISILEQFQRTAIGNLHFVIITDQYSNITLAVPLVRPSGAYQDSLSWELRNLVPFTDIRFILQLLVLCKEDMHNNILVPSI